MKLARNDPCSCGSGKKYKHCCLHLSVVQTQPLVQNKAHDGAIEKSMAWLATHQRKGWQVAFSRLMEELLDERDREEVSKLDDETIAGIQINLTEWLLAEGSILVKGVSRRVADYLIGPFGPAMTPGQRDWIQQMSQRPLRLYSVTDVHPGEQMTLCDALDVEAKPVVVLERFGSQSIHPGNFVGARIMRVGDHFELSGAAYQFSMMAGPAAANRLRDTAQEFGHLGGLAQEQALVLMSSWLQQYVSPVSMPTMVDHYSGEPIVSITDHYRVLDWNALTCALQDCADIEGDRSNGWTPYGQNIHPSQFPDQNNCFDCHRCQPRAYRENQKPGNRAHKIAAQSSASSRSARRTRLKHPAPAPALAPDLVTNSAAQIPRTQSRYTHHRPFSTALPSSPRCTARPAVN